MGCLALKVVKLMEGRDFHLRFPRIYTFVDWVLTPKTWGSHLGLRNWVKYLLMF